MAGQKPVPQAVVGQSLSSVPEGDSSENPRLMVKVTIRFLKWYDSGCLRCLQNLKSNAILLIVCKCHVSYMTLHLLHCLSHCHCFPTKKQKQVQMYSEVLRKN